MKTRPTQHNITPKLTRVYLSIRTSIHTPVSTLPGAATMPSGFTFLPCATFERSSRRVQRGLDFLRRQACLKKRRGGGAGNSPAQPLAGGDAGHDDALGSRGGHSLERPLPKLLKEQLLLQLRPQRQRGAAVGKLERTRGLHLRSPKPLGVLTRSWRSAHELAAGVELSRY